MRILVVAYDYPPTQSPRALRWYYLTRELALLGHEVHVLVPDLGEPEVELPNAPGRVVVHRSFPGPFAWLVSMSKRRRSAGRERRRVSSPAEGAARLNWRGRIADALKRALGQVVFPDVRGEWAPSARRALGRLLAEVAPDVVVTSHEPAVTLPLGIYAQDLGFAWVADLGDPVCAAYTAPRWRRRAMALEASVLARADRVLVTNDATRRLLDSRHGQGCGRCEVLPNGYDDRRVKQEKPGEEVLPFDEQRLELVYAGRLYGYRHPGPLLQAIAETPGVRLTMIVPDPPPSEDADAILAAAGNKLRVLGQTPHAEVLRLLERADVLVNLGDQGQPVRTPAKLFEYFGIDRPVLHVHSDGADAAAELLQGKNRGWLCKDETGVLSSRIAELRERKREGKLYHGLSLDPLADYAHSALGRRLETLLMDAVAGPGHAGRKGGRGTCLAGRINARPDPG